MTNLIKSRTIKSKWPNVGAEVVGEFYSCYRLPLMQVFTATACPFWIIIDFFVEVTA
jgi:hypothetical protein